jgi:hypothetical protein
MAQSPQGLFSFRSTARINRQEDQDMTMSDAKFVLIIFLIGSILFVLGAAALWGSAGFVMALGLTLVFFAHGAMVENKA